MKRATIVEPLWPTFAVRSDYHASNIGAAAFDHFVINMLNQTSRMEAQRRGNSLVWMTKAS